MSKELVVSVSEGKLQGRIGLDEFGRQFYSYQGIPYAKPPIGKLRFKAPQPPQKWSDIRDATIEGNDCYGQNLIGEYAGSEDCLFLNVYTPQLPSKGIKLKPVMVWIHGGGFTSGSSKCELYGPEYLIAQDIVLVTINYRTGVLGFLNLEDSSLGVPGNAGLKDMVMALKWVQKNIKQFAGDQKNVTIFGESAGGSAVHFLMLSPMAKGLFHKVIAQSGSSLNTWARGLRSVNQLAKLTDFEGYDEKHILNHLQDLPVEELYEGSKKIKDDLNIGNVRPFCPVIEKASKEPAFLLKEPEDILKSGKYNKVPLLMGYTSREGMWIHGTSSLTKRLLHEETIVPYKMNLRKGSPAYKNAVNKIKEYYQIKSEITSNDTDSILKLYTHNYFFVDIFNTAKYHLSTSNTPLYFYRFSLDTEFNGIKKLFSFTEPGASHADDCCYLFKGILNPELEPNSAEETAVKRVTKLWANFAKFGNPTPNDGDSLLNVKWIPATKQKFNYLDIGEVLTMESDPENGAAEFWNNLHNSINVVSKL